MEKIISNKINEARKLFDLQKASAGKPKSVSEWLEKAFNKIYKQGFKDGENSIRWKRLHDYKNEVIN